MNKIVAIIITYNINKNFHKGINSLRRQVDEIVVVDNGSNKATINILKELGEIITLIKLNENKGIAYALNKGIKYALSKDYKWILTLDHDSIPCENMVKIMLDTYYNIDKEKRKNIAMITPIHIEESNKYIKNELEKGYSEVLTEITSGALVKSNIYRNFGIYDEKLFIDLVDHDYCLSLNLNGYKIIQVKSAVLLHNLGESIEKNIFGIRMIPTNHSPIRRYYMTRNRLHLWNKYKNDFPEWVANDKRRFISETIKILLFEKDKNKKIKMILIGRKDYKNNIWGRKE